MRTQELHVEIDDSVAGQSSRKQYQGEEEYWQDDNEGRKNICIVVELVTNV